MACSSVCPPAGQKCSAYPEGAMTGHIYTGYFVFHCLQTNYEIDSNFQFTVACFLCSPHDFNALSFL